MHKVKKDILSKLKFQKTARFSELKGTLDSNKFAYHIKQLEQEDYIIKEGEKYSLSNEGKKLINFEETAQPVSVVAMLPFNNGKYLLQQRTKEPWFGYWMFVAGKIRFGEKIEESALRELKEETQLSGKLKLMGMVSSRTFDNNKLLYHIHMYCFAVNNIKGELQNVHKEGKNVWLDINEISEKNIHPVDFMIFNKRNDAFWIIEQEEHLINGQFVEIKTKNLTLPS